jgi:acyl-coenzyme A synthetase/AMP-(fatty) acid ligase
MFIPLLATDFMKRAVSQYGKKVGVVDGQRRFTYAEFGERVNRLSNALLDLGVRKGDRVGVIDTNTHRLLELHFGAPQIGAILLPINIRLSPREIADVLNDSGARILLINEDMMNLIGQGIPSRRGVHNRPGGRNTFTGRTDRAVAGLYYESFLAGASPLFRTIRARRERPCGDVLHERHLRHPQGDAPDPSHAVAGSLERPLLRGRRCQ